MSLNKSSRYGKLLYYILLALIPLYVFTIGTPQKTEFNRPPSIAILTEEGSNHESYRNSGIIVKTVNKYQVTENWITFEIINVRFYNQALVYSILFDTLIILTWRLKP